MISRASVPMWGKAGQSAGPQKSAGKKSDCESYCRSGGTDLILSTQRIPRGRDLIFSTQRMPRRRELIFSTHSLSGPLWDFVNEKRRLYIEKISRCAGEMVKSQRVWYEWNFPAARAKTLRNPRRKRHMHLKNFPAARAKWVRNPIRITDTEVHWFVFPWPLWDFLNEKRRLYIEKFSRCAGEMVKS